MEAELAKFRAQLKKKSAEEDTEKSPQPASKSLEDDRQSPEPPSSPLPRRRIAPSVTVAEPMPSSSRIVVTDEPIVDETPSRWTRVDVAVFASKLVLWALLMALAVVVQFGAVFFVVSVFYVIFTNLRDRPRKRGELSAYSVFNPNVESIAGTVSAEDFEKQLQYGALH
ncbi:unnamed protein product [Ixodes pacificus]